MSERSGVPAVGGVHERLAQRTGTSFRRRVAAFVATAAVLAVATLFGAPSAAVAAPVTRAPSDLCTTDEWRNPANFQSCVDRLQDLSQQRIQCLQSPTPSAPDSGMAGWFASASDENLRRSGRPDLYTKYGYAGYGYNTYDIGCVPTVMHPDYKFTTTMANGELLLATSVIGASNALRERAWNPKFMWGWADPLVDKATKAIYSKVFTVFGAVTLVVVGLYLLWRSRQSELSSAMTTAGWAVLVMVAVTAIAAWPTWSANVADRTLMTSLGVIHDAVGPPSQQIPAGECRNPDPAACTDVRPPAVRASDTATEGLLYRHWLRGALGSSDSETARRYGPVLYDARSFSWDEIEDMRADPKQRQPIIDQKAKRWMKVAEQIKSEDPEAYEYLQGTRDMDRVGAGFIAILSSLFFALFDITASVLVLLGFLIFRWAVIAAPILGTLGLLRPASTGIRRLANAVVAAIFNIIIFGTGAAIYLFAVNLIMGTASLPGWLQVVLIWLTGVVGWLLLRPYRRITQLGGKDSTETVTSAGRWHRLFLRDVRAAAALKVVEGGGTAEPAIARRAGTLDTPHRPESRTDDVGVAGTPASRPEQARPSEPARADRRRRWERPDVPEDNPSYTIYRPGSDRSGASVPPVRRPESVSTPG